MGCLHLLGTAQIPKPWNQIVYCNYHFLFHVNFHIIFALYHSYQDKRYMIYATERRTARFSVETVNSLQLVVNAGSNKCQLLSSLP